MYIEEGEKKKNQATYERYLARIRLRESSKLDEVFPMEEHWEMTFPHL